MADLWVTYEDQPPKTPVEGDVWRNMNREKMTIQGIPHGHYAVWNGTAWMDAGSKSWMDGMEESEQEEE